MTRNDAVNNVMNHPILGFIINRILNLYTFAFGGWNLIPFVFLKPHKWWHIYKQLNFMGYIFIPGAFLAGPLLRIIFPPSKRTVDSSNKESSKKIE